MAIQRYAAEHVADSTVRAVDDSLRRHEGPHHRPRGPQHPRFEKATGVDIIVDDTPGVIVVSCFDPIRRAIAGEALEKLVADGRMHPSRIEEVVEQVAQGDGRAHHQARQGGGQSRPTSAACIPRSSRPWAGCTSAPATARTCCGTRSRSRTSARSSPTSSASTARSPAAAASCTTSARRWTTRWKAATRRSAWSSAASSARSPRPCSTPSAATTATSPPTTPYTPIVMAADAISGAAPGARRESHGAVHQAPRAAGGDRHGAVDGVDQAYAIQAGREVRVIVDAKQGRRRRRLRDRPRHRQEGRRRR